MRLWKLQGAISIGKELCRVNANKKQRIALLKMNNVPCDVRADLGLQVFKRDCPNIQVTVAIDYRCNETSIACARKAFENIFLVDATISTVLTTADVMAMGVIEAADKMLPPYKARSILVSGFDNSLMLQKSGLLAQKRVFITVDQGMTTSGDGVWSALPKTIKLIEDRNLHSTKEVQKVCFNSMHSLSTIIKRLTACIVGAWSQESHFLNKHAGSAACHF